MWKALRTPLRLSTQELGPTPIDQYHMNNALMGRTTQKPRTQPTIAGSYTQIEILTLQLVHQM